MRATKHITIRLTPTTIAALREIAATENNHSISTVIREAIQHWTNQSIHQRNTNRTQHILWDVDRNVIYQPRPLPASEQRLNPTTGKRYKANDAFTPYNISEYARRHKKCKPKSSQQPSAPNAEPCITEPTVPTQSKPCESTEKTPEMQITQSLQKSEEPTDQQPPQTRWLAGETDNRIYDLAPRTERKFA